MPNPFTIPGAPAELMERINARRARFAPGMIMTADQPPADPPANEKDEPLGPSGEKALREERDARKELEKHLKAMQDQFAGLAEAFGVKTDKGANPDESVAELTKSVSGIQRELAVERLARKHGISDEDDITTLMAVSDEAARTKLAARLAPVSDKGDKPDNLPRPRLPKPDSTQGSKGDPARLDVRPGLPRLTEGITAALESKN